MRNILAWLVFTTTAISFNSTSLLAATPQGVAVSAHGDVKIQHKENSELSPVKVGEQVFEGDMIETKESSQARIVTIDNNYLTVLPNTKRN